MDFKTKITNEQWFVGLIELTQFVPNFIKHEFVAYWSLPGVGLYILTSQKISVTLPSQIFLHI